MTVGVLEAVVIRDQHGPVCQRQCQHIEVNVRKTGQVSRRTGGRLGVVEGRSRRRPPLNVSGFNEHGSRRAQTLKFVDVAKLHTRHPRDGSVASGEGLPCPRPAPWDEQHNAHHEGTAHPYLLERASIGHDMSWKDTILEAFEVFGPASLFVLSFTEAIVQPIPPDLLYIPMLVNAMGDTLGGVALARGLVASVLGSSWGMDR